MRKKNDKRNTNWISGDWPHDDNLQLRFFPPTEHEILLARVNELEEKLERQRKGQFGKIGGQEKRLADLEQRFEWMERGLCRMNKEEETQCEILEMVGQ